MVHITELANLFPSDKELRFVRTKGGCCQLFRAIWPFAGAIIAALVYVAVPTRDADGTTDYWRFTMIQQTWWAAMTSITVAAMCHD